MDALQKLLVFGFGLLCAWLVLFICVKVVGRRQIELGQATKRMHRVWLIATPVAVSIIALTCIFGSDAAKAIGLGTVVVIVAAMQAVTNREAKVAEAAKIAELTAMTPEQLAEQKEKDAANQRWLRNFVRIVLAAAALFVPVGMLVSRLVAALTAA